MSVTTAKQPYSTAARGKLPIPAWIKMPLAGAAILGSVSAATWFFVIPHKSQMATPRPVDWTPGQAITLPQNIDVPPPSGPAIPGPADSTVPPPPPEAPPTVRHMRVWGADDSTGGIGRPFGGASPYPPPHLSPAAPEAGQGPQTEYASMLVPTKMPSGEAVVDADISLLLPETTTFECIPDAPLDTQLPGGISCTVGENVWSADGSNILIDKYAKVSGEVTRGLAHGADRAFILWRSVRSKRVHAELNSPATDELGEIGAPGVVDTHLWAKVKATIMLTGIETAGNVAQNLASRGNGNSYVNFSNGQSLASQELQHDINIPNTLWRGQGWPLRVYVQHDIQFGRAYNNVLVAGAAR